MKLLIADDEELTRQGLVSSIDWNSLGIREIFQADDGVNALRVARAEKPDIILCDIRMPRMNGIQMIEQLKKFLPDSSIIFMSGYSDKEYLKSAIKLEAVNYVEKPLNLEEIKDAVREASERCQQRMRTRLSETLHSMRTASQLALFLTKPYKDNASDITSLCSELDLVSASGWEFTTFIAKLKVTELNTEVSDQLYAGLNEHLEHYHLRALYVQLHAVYHVFHIIGKNAPSASVLTSIEEYLSQYFSPYEDYFLVRGETVSGISRAYHSYTSAVLLLQSCFFFNSGTVLALPKQYEDTDLAATANSSTGDLPFDAPADFSEALLSKDQDGCLTLLGQIYTQFHENTTLLPNQVKDLYYKLFIAVNNSAQKLKVNPDISAGSTEESIIDQLESCFTYQELHNMLVARTSQFFDCLKSYEPEDSTIFIIKDYISKHYMDDRLSIKDISDHVFLSTSYVCTYFKNQTGQTLNQYLTDYRMKKAMSLLADARYQIADISSKVGYNNGNYFSKSFKKYTGLSPSKYREKMLE